MANESSSGSRTMSTVVGLFHDRDDAERAIRALRDAGFSDSSIGLAMRDADRQQEISESTGTTGEGVKKGAVSGGIVGGLAGLLGSLLVPGLGPIVVAGWLGSTLVGAGIGAAAGGLIGGLVDLGVSDDEARHFERGVHGGGILVTVDAGTRAHEAYDLLHDAGADLGPEPVASTSYRSMQAERLQLRNAESWRGNERRFQDDAKYSGPERRVAMR